MTTPTALRNRGALITVAALVLIVLGMAQTGFGGSALRYLGIAAAPTPYTALAFSDPASLDDEAEVGTQISLPFTVTNHEGSARDYSWNVTVDDAAGSRSVSQGAVSVAAGATAEVPLVVDSPCTVGSIADARFTVSLASIDRSIDHTVTCGG